MSFVRCVCRSFKNYEFNLETPTQICPRTFCNSCFYLNIEYSCTCTHCRNFFSTISTRNSGYISSATILIYIYIHISSEKRQNPDINQNIHKYNFNVPIARITKNIKLWHSFCLCMQTIEFTKHKKVMILDFPFKNSPE